MKRLNDFARPGLVLAGLASAVFLATCVDFGTSPVAGSPIRASFALAPVYPANAHGALKSLADAGLPLDRVRIVITRPGTGEVLKDTTVTMHAGDAAITLELTVPALAGEKLGADMQFKSGDTVLFEGTATVTAVSSVSTSGGGAPPVTITVSYVGPGAKAKKVIVTPGTTNLPANAPTTFTAQAFDSTNAVIPNTPFTWSLSDSTLGSIDGNGVFTPAGKRGLLSITAATLGGISGGSVDSLFPPAAKLVVTSGDKQSTTILTTAAQPLVVSVLAADNLGVPGQSVTFAATDGGSVSPSTVTTDAAGTAQTTIRFGSRIGTYNFTATSGAFSAGATGTSTVGAPASIAASGATTFTFTSGVVPSSLPKVLVTDAGSNPVPNATVTLGVTTAAGSKQTTLSTDANGIATAPASLAVSGLAGSMTLAFSITGVTGSPVTFTGTIVAGAAKNIAAFAGDNQSSTPNTAVAIKPAVIVKDTNGNVVSGVAVTFAVTAGGGSATGLTQTTGTDGVATVGGWVVGSTTGSNTLTATSAGLSGSPVLFFASTSFGTIHHFTVTATDGTPVGTQIAGVPFNVTITAKDVNNNTVSSFGGTVSVSANNGTFTAGSGTSAAFTNGVLTPKSITVGIITPGPLSIKVVSGTVQGNSNTFTVNPGAAAKLAVLTPAAGANSGAAFTTQPVVQIQDAGGNVITGDNSTVVTMSVSTGATTVGTATATAVAGVATFTNVGITGTLQPYTLTYSATGLTSASNGILLGAGSATSLAFAAVPAGSMTTLPFTTQPVVQIRDVNNNVATAETGPMTMTVSAGATTLGTTTVSAVAGVATFSGVGITGTPGVSYTLTFTYGALTKTQVIVPSSRSNTWTSAADGNWSTASNWSRGVPVAGDSVLIGGTVTDTVSLDADATAAYVILGGSSGTQRLKNLGHTLTVTGNFVVGSHGAYDNLAGVNAGSGTLVNQGTVTMNGGSSFVIVSNPVANQGLLIASGTVSLNAALSTTAGSTIRVGMVDGTTGQATLATSAFTNNGTIELTEIGAFGAYASALSVSGTLTNGSGGTIHVIGGTMPGGSRIFTGVLNNQGQVIVDQPFTIAQGSGATTNSGTMNANANFTLTMGAGVSFTNTGTLTAAGGDTVSVFAGTFNGNVGTLAGAGALSLTGTIATFQNSIAIGSLILNSSTASITNPFSTATTALSMSSSTLGGTGTLTNPAGVTLKLFGSTIGATFINQGTLIASATSSVTGSFATGGLSKIQVGQLDGTVGAATLSFSSGFTNNGTIELTNFFATGYTATLTVNGTLVNFGTIAAKDGTGHGARTLAAELDNRSGGVVSSAFQSPLTISKAGAHHSNAGTIDATGGNMIINDGGTAPSLVNTGTIAVGSDNGIQITGDSLNSSGTFSGNGSITLTNVHAVFPTTQSVPTTGNWTLNGTTFWIGGPISNVPPMNIFPTNSRIIGNASASVTNASTNGISLNGSEIDVPFINNGQLYVTGTSVLGDTLKTAAGSVIHIGQADGTIGLASLTLAKGVENNGTIELSEDFAGQAYASQLTVSSGTLKNIGTIATLDGSTGGGARTIVGTVDNLGTISINSGSTTPGILNITGDLTGETSSIFNMDLISDTQYDQIIATGALTFRAAALFQLSYIGGYSLINNGNHFTLATAGTTMTLGPTGAPSVTVPNSLAVFPQVSGTSMFVYWSSLTPNIQ